MLVGEKKQCCTPGGTKGPHPKCPGSVEEKGGLKRGEDVKGDSKEVGKKKFPGHCFDGDYIHAWGDSFKEKERGGESNPKQDRTRRRLDTPPKPGGTRRATKKKIKHQSRLPEHQRKKVKPRSASRG